MDKRTEQMIELYHQGKTLASIGQIFTLSRQRVQQILSRAGVVRRNPGKRKKIPVSSKASETGKKVVGNNTGGGNEKK